MWWWSKRATVARWLCSRCDAPMVRVHHSACPLPIPSVVVHPPTLQFTQDWCEKLYKGATVAGIIFVVDSTEFRPFLGALPSVARAPGSHSNNKEAHALLHARNQRSPHAMPDGQIGSDDEYKRMEDVYKRFHGVAGQAHNSILVGVVCAHKIDLATVRSTVRCTRGPRTHADNPPPHNHRVRPKWRNWRRWSPANCAWKGSRSATGTPRPDSPRSALRRRRTTASAASLPSRSSSPTTRPSSGGTMIKNNQRQ